VTEALGAWIDRNKRQPTPHPYNSSCIKMITKKIDECDIGYYNQCNEHMLLGTESEFLRSIDGQYLLSQRRSFLVFAKEAVERG